MVADPTIERIDKFVNNLVKFKNKEYESDNAQLQKRFYNGLIGEAAIEILINRQFINWTVGESRYYNKADMLPLGFDMGIKSVEYGKFPVIHKHPKRPEIINFITDYNKVLVCGVASIYTMKLFQNDDYILSPQLRKKGTKTCFYGFSQLFPLKDYKTLDIAYYSDMFMQKIAM
ncbi:MAG: hypothetical protein ACOCRO_06280 [Halanaerobiales bacterium]